MAFWRNVAFWQISGTVLSILIAVAAAAFTGMQWHEAHNQLLLSMTPSINFYTEDDPDEPPVGVAINNAGPGPAVIKSITYYVDRKPLRDVNEAIDYSKLNPDQIEYVELEENDTLAVTEKVWLLKYHKPRGGKVKQKEKELDDFVDFIDQKLGIEVLFCSVTAPCCTDRSFGSEEWRV